MESPLTVGGSTAFAEPVGVMSMKLSLICRRTSVTVWVCADRPCNYLATGQSAGIRTWFLSKYSRDPASQSEFFIPDSHLQTFNWLLTLLLYVANSQCSCLRHSRFQNGWQSFRFITDLITNSIRLQTQTVTPALCVSFVRCLGRCMCTH